MDVQSAVGRDLEERLRQQHSVGHHYQRLRPGRTHARSGIAVQRLGLVNGKAARFGELCDRARCRALSAPGGAVRLRKDQGNFVPGSQDAGQRVFGKPRRACEN